MLATTKQSLIQNPDVRKGRKSVNFKMALHVYQHTHIPDKTYYGPVMIFVGVLSENQSLGTALRSAWGHYGICCCHRVSTSVDNRVLGDG